VYSDDDMLMNHSRLPLLASSPFIKIQFLIPYFPFRIDQGIIVVGYDTSVNGRGCISCSVVVVVVVVEEGAGSKEEEIEQE